MNFSGLDSNGDGSTANDRPIIGNAAAPFQSAGIDGYYIGGTPGTYYDMLTYNTLGSKVVVDPNSEHFLIQRGQKYLSREIGRDTFLQPGYQQHDIAVEKGFGLSYFRFDRGTLNLRVEANDFPNHNNVAPLGVNLASLGSSTQFNPVVSRTVSSRSLVLWARLVF